MHLLSSNRVPNHSEKKDFGESLEAIELVGEFEGSSPVLTTGAYRYEVSADGQRFLTAGAQPNSAAPLTLIQNWAAGLKK